MRKLLIAIVTLAVALAAIGAFALSNLEGWINENRDWISARAEESLGRPLSFEEVSVSLGLGLGVNVSDLRIAEDPAYGDGDIVAIEEARVGVRVLPALRGRFEITHVTLVRPDVRIVKTADGLNIAGFGSTSDPPAGEGGPSSAAFVALTNIEEGRITFTDRTVDPPVVMSADHVTCEVSDISVDSPIRFKLAAAVLGAASANVSARGTLGPFDPATPALTPVEIEARTGPLPVAELLRLYEAVAGAGEGPSGIEVDGSADASISATGTSEMLAIEAAIDATDARVIVPGSLDKSAGVRLKIDFSGTLAPGSIGVKRASLVLHNARVDAHGTIDFVDSSSLYNLQLTAEPFELEGWQKLLPPLSAFDISGTMAATVAVIAETGSGAGELPTLDGTINFTDVGVRSADLPEIDGLTTTVFLRDGGATLPQTGMRVAGSTVTVQATVENFSAPTATFTLGSPSLDLTALGLGGSGQEADPGQDEPAAHDTLRNVRLRGSYDSKPPELDATLLSPGGTLAGAAYTDLHAKVRLEAGRYVFNPIELDALGGRLRGEGFYAPTQQGARPEFNFEARATGVNMGELVASRIVGGQLLIDGALDAKVSLAGSGAEWEQIRNALVGGARLELTNGRVLDVNIAESLLQQLTGVPGLSSLVSSRVRERHPKLFTTGDTVFEDMAGEFSIADGRMSSRDLTLHAEDFSLHGRAEVGLDRSLDVAATFEASEKLTATLVSEINAMKYLKGSSGRVQIPFRLRGFLPDVRPEPDMRFVRDALQRALLHGLTDYLLRPKNKSTGSGKAGSP